MTCLLNITTVQDSCEKLNLWKIVEIIVNYDESLKKEHNLNLMF